MPEDGPVEPDIPEPRKLPSLYEFSPGVVGDLASVLVIITLYEGSRSQLREALASAFIKTTGKQRLNRANNILIGMSQCGLFDLKSNRLTEVGQKIAHEESEEERSNLLARQLLMHCHGLELIDVTDMIRARGEALKLQAIREELRARGFRVKENEGDASKIREWLEQASLVDKDWNVNEAKLIELIGAESTTLAEWCGLERGQRAFLQQLRSLASGPDAWVPVRQIKQLCEGHWGNGVFPEGRLRAEVIDPLVDSAWILAKGKGGGRGGGSGTVLPLPKLTDLTVSLPVETHAQIPHDLRRRLATPLDTIFQELESDSTHVKGIALELLALRLVRDVGLFPVAFRRRSDKTRGAEVDLIANGLHLHHSRWIVQCKNTKKVSLSDVAKEVGVAYVMRANVIVIVTTGELTTEALRFAAGVSRSSNLQVVTVNRAVLRKYRKSGGTAVVDSLRAQAEVASRIKTAHVSDEL